MDVARDLAHALTDQGRAHRDAAGDALGEGHQIGPQTVVLAGKESARAPEPGLYLIDNKHSAALLAQGLHTQQIVCTAEVHTALALHHFDDHSRRLIVNRLFHPLQLVVGDEAEVGDQRLKRPTVLPPPRGAERSHGATVEAAHR